MNYKRNCAYTLIDLLRVEPDTGCHTCNTRPASIPEGKATSLSELRHLQTTEMRKNYNSRQLEVLSYALNNPHMLITIARHQETHKVSYLTARADLLELAEHHILNMEKPGKTLHFTVPEHLHDTIEQRIRTHRA